MKIICALIILFISLLLFFFNFVEKSLSYNKLFLNDKENSHSESQLDINSEIINKNKFDFVSLLNSKLDNINEQINSIKDTLKKKQIEN